MMDGHSRSTAGRSIWWSTAFPGGALKAARLDLRRATFRVDETIATTRSLMHEAEAIVTVREEISETLIAAAICGEIDILVEALPFDETCLNVEPLFSDTFYLAVNRNNPLAGMELVSLDTLGDMPFILLENIHCLTRQIEQYCFNERFMPKVVFQVSQLSTIKLLIELDYGVSILPSIAIDKDPGSCIRYINLDSKGEPPAREVVLAITKDRYLSPAPKYFIAVMKEQYQKTH
jgi:LysR family hydrogen peroxide-inducible transcriptional activator